MNNFIKVPFSNKSSLLLAAGLFIFFGITFYFFVDRIIGAAFIVFGGLFLIYTLTYKFGFDTNSNELIYSFFGIEVFRHSIFTIKKYYISSDVFLNKHQWKTRVSLEILNNGNNLIVDKIIRAEIEEVEKLFNQIRSLNSEVVEVESELRERFFNKKISNYIPLTLLVLFAVFFTFIYIEYIGIY